MLARAPLREVVAGYRNASTSLHRASSRQSRRALDWMNFFIADVQTGFGRYVAFYLAQNGWSQGDTGLALTVGGLAGVLSQIPGGAQCDAVTWKRGLVAIGILAIGIAALTLALTHRFVPVLCAELLHGVTAGIITPAIGAISLGLVGRQAMSLRTGRSCRMMGLAGAYYPPSAMFVAAGMLCIPALIALNFIRPDEIDYARARNATNDHAQKIGRALDLVKNRPLVLFAGAMMLFQLADVSTLPLIGEHIATAPRQGSMSISILIIVPQIVVAIISPWIGYHSEKKGRRPLLLIGFAIEPIRAALLAFTSDFYFLLVAQLLSGVTGAIIGVLTVLVITDLTAGSGRFNLAQGATGAITGMAASTSTLLTGYFFQGLAPGSGSSSSLPLPQRRQRSSGFSFLRQYRAAIRMTTLRRSD